MIELEDLTITKAAVRTVKARQAEKQYQQERNNRPQRNALKIRANNKLAIDDHPCESTTCTKAHAGSHQTRRRRAKYTLTIIGRHYGHFCPVCTKEAAKIWEENNR